MTPRTEAGKRLLAQLVGGGHWEGEGDDVIYLQDNPRTPDEREQILAIEREAAAAALRRIREGVAGLRQIDSVRLDRLDLRREIDDSPLLVLNDVLRLLEGRVVEAVPRSLGEAGDR